MFSSSPSLILNRIIITDKRILLLFIAQTHWFNHNIVNQSFCYFNKTPIKMMRWYLNIILIPKRHANVPLLRLKEMKRKMKNAWLEKRITSLFLRLVFSWYKYTNLVFIPNMLNTHETTVETTELLHNSVLYPSKSNNYSTHEIDWI